MARALTIAAAPHLPEGQRLTIEWRQAHRRLAATPDVDPRTRAAIESALAEPLRRIERLSERIRPQQIQIQHHPSRHLDVSVQLSNRLPRMAFRIWNYGHEPYDVWTRLHILTAGRPWTLWRFLPASSPFPVPYARPWRLVRALTLAAAPHLHGGRRLTIAWQQGRRHLVMTPDVDLRTFGALESALAKPLRRIERLDEALRPQEIQIRQYPSSYLPGMSDPPTLAVSVQLPNHASRMTFSIWDDGGGLRAAWKPLRAERHDA
jgi:hypothetical protein